MANEILENERLIVEEQIFVSMRNAEYRDINEPEIVTEGERIRFCKNHSNLEKEEIVEVCINCNGSSKWVNPRNSNDIRKCFSCDGTGEKRISGSNLKTEDGKLKRIIISAGAEGVVIWVGTFRAIYQNGNNKFGRDIYSCKVRLDDGRVVNTPLAKLARAKEKLSDEVLRLRAKELSFNYNFATKVVSGEE